MTDAERLKDEARAVWSSGNYGAVARGIREVGRTVVDAVGVARGERVLDVGTGTGNAAIDAARSGGDVTGLDLAPRMLDAARRRAAEAGVSIQWVEGDAEALPFEAGSFDVAISAFGVMFAPRHAVAAAEMARVVRDGGRIGLANWSSDGTVGDLFRAIGRHLPDDGHAASLRWGVEEHVRDCFAGTGVELTFQRRRLESSGEIDLQAATAFYLASFGPLVRARARLEPEGRWDAAASDLSSAVEEMLRTSPEWLLVVGVKRPASTAT